MPYELAYAKKFLSHRGINIYHIYKNNMVDDGQYEYWFGLHPLCHEGDRTMFDVREAAHDMGMPMPEDEPDIKMVIIQAIEQGLITQRSHAF